MGLDVVLLLLYLLHLCTGNVSSPLACARKFRSTNGEGEFYFDPSTGVCKPGSDSTPVGKQWKIYKVYNANKDEGCVKWNHVLTIRKNDTAIQNQEARAKLGLEVRLGKKFRVLYRGNYDQSNYSLLTADSIYTYGDIICATSVQTSKDSTFKLAQHLFCSDGYSQYVETPILVASPQPSRVVKDLVFTEMKWFVRENSCYHLSYEHDKDGHGIARYHDELVKDILENGNLIIGFKRDFIKPIETVTYPNTLVVENNAIKAFSVEGLALRYNFIDRFVFDSQTTKRLIEIHRDAGRSTVYTCDFNSLNTEVCKQTTTRRSQKLFVDKRWVKTYGKAFNGYFGNKTELIAAISRGHHVRVVVEGLSSEPTVIVVDDNTVTAMLVDQFVEGPSTVPLIQSWFVVTSSGRVSGHHFLYENMTELPPHPAEHPKHYTWYTDNSVWKQVCDTSQSDSCGWLEKAVESGAELRIKWEYNGNEGFYNIDCVQNDYGVLIARPKHLIPIIFVHPSLFLGLPSFISNGTVVISTCRDIFQPCDLKDEEYSSQNMTWFVLDGQSVFD